MVTSKLVEFTEFWQNMSALLKPALGFPRFLSLAKDSKVTQFWLVFEGAVVARHQYYFYVPKITKIKVSLHRIKFLNTFFMKICVIIIIFVWISWNYFQGSSQPSNERQFSKRKNPNSRNLPLFLIISQINGWFDQHSTDVSIV